LKPLKLFAALFIISLSFATVPSAYAIQNGETVDFTIIHSSDVHAHILPFDCASGTAMGGYARIKSYKEALEQEGKTVIPLSSGDIFQGTFFYRFYGGIPDIEFLNKIGFKAMTLGNHEFDGGQKALSEALGFAKFPVLSANLKFSRIPELAAKVKPYTLVDVKTNNGTVKVGILGLTVENLKENVPAVFVKDIQVETAIDTTAQYLPEIQAAGAEVILILSHLGWDKEVQVLEAFPEIDGVLGGHTHLAIDPPIIVEGSRGHRFISQPGEWGSHITRYDISLTKQSNKTHLMVKSAGLIPMRSDLPQDDEILKEADGLWQQIMEKVNVPLSKTLNFLDGERANIRNHETNLGNLITDVLMDVVPADMAVMNGGGIRSSIATGTITIGDCLNVLPFDNYLVRLTLTGASIKKIFNQLAEKIATSPGFGGFLQVSKGLTVHYTNESTTVKYMGKAIEDEKLYTLTTNDFLSWGGNGIPAFTEAIASESTGILAADGFMTYLKQNKEINYSVEGRISSELKTPEYKKPGSIVKSIPQPETPKGL
jgi:5'-nucleotidase